MSEERWRRTRDTQRLADIQARNAARQRAGPSNRITLTELGYFQDEADLVNGAHIVERNPRPQRHGPPAPEMQGPPDPQTVEARRYADRIELNTQNRFDRWFDAVDPAEELQRFLYKCFQFGQAQKREGSMDIDQLEERLAYRPLPF